MANEQKGIPLLTIFIKDRFNFDKKGFEFSLIRSAEENLKLMARLAALPCASNYVEALHNIDKGLKPPKLVIIDQEATVAIITDPGNTDSKTIEIFDPSLENDLVALAKEYKQICSCNIEISITPKSRMIHM
jgi:hypothetical protein